MKQKKANDVEEEEVILLRLSFYLIRLGGVLVTMNKFDIEKKMKDICQSVHHPIVSNMDIEGN